MELWDIYDENKKPTGRTMKRNDWNMKPGDYHLHSMAIIQNLDGKFLISQRAMNKEWAPGWWEFPGGGVAAGETSKEAVIREIREETGLDISNEEPFEISTYKSENAEEKNNYFVDIYLYKFNFSEADIKIPIDEVTDFKLATKEQILAKKDEFLHFKRIEGLI